MKENVKKMEQWLRASGFYCIQITDASTEQVGIFLHFDDCKKSKEKTVASVAKKLGVRIDLSDKGVCFF